MLGSQTHSLRSSPDPANPLTGLFKSGQRLSYSKGEIVLRPDDESPGIFYVESGYVKVFSINDRGEEYLHIIYGANEIFPLIWVMSGQPRNVFYRAVTACALLRVPGKKFQDSIEADSTLCFAVLKQVTKQFNVYTNRVDNLEYKYGRERLVYRLLFLAGRFGKRRGKSVTLPPFTQNDIASSINLSRESASREIERLEERGLVSYDGRILTLNDVEALGKEIKGADLKRWGLR